MSRIPDIKDAYKNLHAALGDEVFKQYTSLLKLYYSSKISKIKFDEDARNVLCSQEHIHLHNMFLLSFSSPAVSLEFSNEPRNVRYASQELCLPDSDLIRDRILVSAIDNGLEGAEDGVTDIIVAAVQIFLKNIITAMLSRTSGYKIRENNFQHAVGLPATNPWLRNSSNMIDNSQEVNIEINEEEKSFEPMPRSSLEIVEQQTAFNFACSRAQNKTNANLLTLRCLYETLLQNPQVINNHSIYSVNLERILAMLDCS